MGLIVSVASGKRQKQRCESFGSSCACARLHPFNVSLLSSGRTSKTARDQVAKAEPVVPTTGERQDAAGHDDAAGCFNSLLAGLVPASSQAHAVTMSRLRLPQGNLLSVGFHEGKQLVLDRLLARVVLLI